VVRCIGRCGRRAEGFDTNLLRCFGPERATYPPCERGGLMRGPAKPADPSPTDAQGQGHRWCKPSPTTRCPSRTRVIPALRRKVAGPCWDESKGFGQEHLWACLMLRGWMPSPRPGRPRASAAWISRIGQAQSPSRQSRGTGGWGDLVSTRADAPLRFTPAAPQPPAARGKAACQGQPTGRRSGGLRTGQGPITPTVLSSRVRASRL
jgi:hypothetical protein